MFLQFIYPLLSLFLSVYSLESFFLHINVLYGVHHEYKNNSSLIGSILLSVHCTHAFFSPFFLLFFCFFTISLSFQVVLAYAFCQSKKEAIVSILDKLDAENSQSQVDVNDKSMQTSSQEIKHEDSLKLDVWHMLYSDCLSALETCVEGDLKHFHKARYMLAQGLYNRGDSGDLERAKDELSFCFKSSRSAFTINMWEIDSMVKKGRYSFDSCFSSIFNVMYLGHIDTRREKGIEFFCMFFVNNYPK